MNLPRRLLWATLVTGLLLLPGAVGAQKIKSSPDEKGTIRIGNPELPNEAKKGSEGSSILWPEGTIPAPDPNSPQVAVRRSKQNARKQKEMMFGRKPPFVDLHSPTPAPQEPIEPPATELRQGE